MFSSSALAMRHEVALFRRCSSRDSSRLIFARCPFSSPSYSIAAGTMLHHFASDVRGCRSCTLQAVLRSVAHLCTSKQSELPLRRYNLRDGLPPHAASTFFAAAPSPRKVASSVERIVAWCCQMLLAASGVLMACCSSRLLSDACHLSGWTHLEWMEFHLPPLQLRASPIELEKQIRRHRSLLRFLPVH